MNIIELIGNTPLVELRRLNPADGRVQLYGKLESSNPGGSIKDRVALSMVEAGEQSGELTRDKILLEATSGNTGIGMAMMCAAKRYRCQLIMPESASIERRLIMQAYGAEIILTPAKRKTDGAIEKAYALAREFPERYFLADQFNNPANWQAHYKTTAPEIWAQTEGRVTDIVTTLGTSGTAMGLSRWFREHHPEVRVIAVEPYPGHKIQGLKNMKESYRPGIFDKTLPHAIVNVADEDAFSAARRLAAEEGVFAGMSSGAALFAAIERARELDRGCIVAIQPDGGERYLSTTLFKPQQQAEPEVSQLKLFNTMSRRKEVFRPLHPDRVTLYACGPTAFTSPNLAHCRRFIVADLIGRALRFCGYTVASYMNFTDLDDNTIAGAIAANEDLRDFTGRYIAEFKQAAETLGVAPAAGHPLASEHVADMIEIAHTLIHKGYAYEKLGSIYFDISKFKKYGQLSGIDLRKIKLGQTVDLDNYEKENPRDFTLLKRSTLAELKTGLFYETDWGNARPGWHIECSAMATRYLGETIDIHTASQDLMFPHHENEIAIAEALTGKPLANYWLHSGQLLRDGRKMAGDTGNVVTLQEVLDRGYTGREVRFMLLGVYYRKPLPFSFRRLNAARTALRRIDEFTRKLLCLPAGLPHPDIAAYVSELEKVFTGAIHDDLNISGAIGALFHFIKHVNPIVQDGQLDKDQKNDVLEALRQVNTVLGVLRLEQCPLPPEIDRLIRLRERARQLKDWTAADSAREELLRQGVTIHDTASGPVWERSDDDRV
ncbi:MAG: cysteine--tRNA ligase [Desulfobulbaceae bacterium]|nr:cysteine--tRNA ligase [Desulfobulbaceae bacterium]